MAELNVLERVLRGTIGNLLGKDERIRSHISDFLASKINKDYMHLGQSSHHGFYLKQTLEAFQ